MAKTAPLHPYRTLFQQLAEAQHQKAITVNNRLAAYLREQYALWQVQQGHAVWPSNQILSINQWIDQLWQAHQLNSDQPLQCISAQYESFLWQETVASICDQPLLDTQKLASQIQRAWQHCVQWGQAIDDIPCVNEAGQLFKQCVRAFEQRLSDHGLIASVQRVSLLKQQGCVGADLCVRPLILIGFDDITPNLKTFLETNYTYNTFDLPTQSCTEQLCSTPTQKQALAKTLWHCLKTLQQHSDKRIAVVVPDLQQRRVHIDLTLQQLLAASPEMTVSYRVSGGQALSQFSIIQTALNSLQLDKITERSVLISWIQSSYLAGAQQYQTARDQFAKYCYEHLPKQTNLKAVIRLHEKFLEQKQNIDTSSDLNLNSDTALSELFDLLINNSSNNNAEMPDKNPKTSRQLIAQHWLTLLKQIGWPGDQSLESDDHQTVKRFYQILQDWTQGFDHKQSIETISYTQALREFKHCLNTTLFQPEDQSKPRLDILGRLEIAGLCYDEIWILDATEQNLPQAIEPAPFYPLNWQQQRNMPRSNPVREIELAQRWLQRLRAQTSALNFVYGQYGGEVVITSSPLLAHLSPKPFDVDLPYTLQIKQAELTEVLDTAGLSLNQTHDLAQPLPGGSAFFKSQALCPFQAYARFRLQAQSMRQSDETIDPALRGTMLHAVLESCWQTLQSHSVLLKLDGQGLQALVSLHVKRMIQHYQRKLPALFSAAIVKLESTRLTELVTDWLNHEKLRPDFSVEQTEHQLDFQINNMIITLRIDRIDQIDTGERIVIDYKTGRVPLSNLGNERLTEAQLPLYALATQAQAVTFAQVIAGDIKFNGISEDDLQIEGVTAIQNYRYTQASDWQSQIQQWHADLSKLSEAMEAGDAQVDPVNLASACQYCDLQGLCRRKAL